MKKLQQLGLLTISTLLLISLLLSELCHDKKFHCIFLNVGQGDATLIITPDNKKILIDSGPDNTVINQLSQFIPFYDKEIDLFILTHPDKDHIFGSIELLKRFTVHNTLNSAAKNNNPLHSQYLKAHTKKSTKYLIADPGFTLQLSKHTKLRIFSQNFFNQTIQNKNNQSLIFQIQHKDTKIFFSGDAEESAENIIAHNYPNKTLQSDIFQAGHHGSKTSNKQEFINKINPKISILSYGADNRFGHPHPQSINSLKKSQLLHTKEGNIHFIF